MLAGLAPTTIANTLNPFQAIYRHVMRRDESVAINPTRELEFPAANGRRERIASPTEAAALLAALPGGDRALWATALLRRAAPRRVAGAALA